MFSNILHDDINFGNLLKMIVISKFFDKSLVKINVNKKSLVYGA